MERTQDMQVMPSTFIVNSMVFEGDKSVSEGEYDFQRLRVVV